MGLVCFDTAEVKNQDMQQQSGTAGVCHKMFDNPNQVKHLKWLEVAINES